MDDHWNLLITLASITITQPNMSTCYEAVPIGASLRKVALRVSKDTISEEDIEFYKECPSKLAQVLGLDDEVLVAVEHISYVDDQAERPVSAQSIEQAIKTLTGAMQDDSYAIGWQANLACTISDVAKVAHGPANAAAGAFIERIFKRNTCTLV